MIQENGCKNWQYWWKSEQQGENFSKEIDILVFKNDHSKWKNLIEQEQKTMKTLPKLWLSRRKNN